MATADQPDLFAEPELPEPTAEDLVPGARLLRGFARAEAAALLAAIDDIALLSPFRRMVTPRGFALSVAMTNCGRFGWVTDRSGYRYDNVDPESGTPWPEMPPLFTTLARRAAEEAGFRDFAPDSCLMNRYDPGARLSPHQDRDERDYGQPIVSLSLGLPAIFLFGGPNRTDRMRRVRLLHADAVVWGGPARLFFHGVAPLAEGFHPATGRGRINLTLRKAL